MTLFKKFKFLGTTISYDLKWQYMRKNETVKKAHQRICFVKELHEFNMSTPILVFTDQ